jgi:rubredoxin
MNEDGIPERIGADKSDHLAETDIVHSEDVECPQCNVRPTNAWMILNSEIENITTSGIRLVWSCPECASSVTSDFELGRSYFRK